ncbi:sucrase/ferredoxin-like domain-containing protein [Aspergillus undulatus]|uniref:sucrase/ferredoxin-like domain-containing protein n=1 Tax=Aspergillus undulatus TaxID=1810928 RepID=UPI003CCDA611
MQSLLRRGASLFTPSPSPSPSQSKPSTPAPNARPIRSAEDFTKAPLPETLFDKTDPATDGEECEHDCATCTIKYPAKFDVDQEDELYGHVNGWSTHLLVATGKTDWVRDVADEEGSVMEAVERGGVVPSNGKLKLSASNMPVPDEYHAHEKGQQPTTVLLLPSFTIIDHVTPALVPDLIRNYVNPSVTNTTPLNGAPAPASEGTEAELPTEEQFVTSLRSRPCPHAAVILLCSQKTRDARCGQSAPLLRREFDRHLRPLGLHRDLDDERPGGVGIYFISHVGGHKYAANVIVYRRRDFDWYKAGEAQAPESGTESDSSAANASVSDEGASQCIWLARVRPEDCENIVRYTVLQGKVVKPGTQLRGGFDRERGLISW